MEYKRNFIYLVCDYATTNILLTTKEIEVANALSAGILNTYVKAFYPENTNPAVLMMLNNVSKHYYLKELTYIDEMLPSSVSEEIINRKKLIQRRKVLMSNWVELCKVSYGRDQIFIDASIVPIIDLELSRSTETPTNLMHELANIMEVDTQFYMDDMRLKIDSTRNMRLRISTVFDKYKNKLNSLTDSEELRQAYRDGVAELVSNAHI